jgi:beta-barrel assembly-enhancing protease
MTTENKLNRREFMALSASAAAGLLVGCAVNPVTGRRQLMFVSESMERDLDRRWSPHQFSADYGAVQDVALNGYLGALTKDLAPHTHRPQAPYNARALNTVVVNAYTFPAGSMGFARGLLLALQSEAELVAVMGHEMGHVSARHASSRQTSGMIAMMLVAGATAYVEHEHSDYTVLAAGLGALGAQALLSRYSRDNEREADKLGMEYMVAAGHPPKGMIGVMDTFRAMNKSKPGMLKILFATHPMSEERYDLASRRATRYPEAQNAPEGRERYLDMTARLRHQRDTVESLQNGQTAMVENRVAEAETHFKSALQRTPADYAGLTMMAKCQMRKKRHAEALRYAEAARAAYPEEPQARHLCGMAKMELKKFDSALADFQAYEEALPGNPNTVFFRGYCHDKADRRDPATREYKRYLQAAPGGEYADWTRKRLGAWGRLNPA